MAIQHMSIDKTISGIGRIILTASNKGGVGKSTVAVNTAIALNNEGMNVGILDCNLNSPSLPQFLNTVENNLQMSKDKKFIPIPAYGVETMSPGNGVERDKALLWKNTFIPQLIENLSKNVEWPDLDYLIIDSPAGTGDILMSINEKIALDGAILVTEDSVLSQQDVLKNVDAFQKLKIPIVGLVKNFKHFQCPECHKVQNVFDGKKKIIDVAEECKLETLATIPADPMVAECTEKGFPVMHAAPGSAAAAAFRQIAKRIISKLPKKTEEQMEEEERIRQEKKRQQEEAIKKLQEEMKKMEEEEKKAKEGKDEKSEEKKE
jgi:ATP-binding protein involved in chromosome partitioning